MRRLFTTFSILLVALGFTLTVSSGAAHADVPRPIYKCLFIGGDTENVSSPQACMKEGGYYLWVYSTFDTKLHGKMDMGKARMAAEQCGRLTCYNAKCTSNFFCSAILGGIIYDGVKVLWNFLLAADETGA